MNNESLPMMAVDVPNVKENALSIKALVKESGKVVGYQLSDDRIVSKEEGVNLARNGEIREVGISRRGDNYYLKSLPDEKENNNLSNLPSISR